MALHDTTKTAEFLLKQSFAAAKHKTETLLKFDQKVKAP